MEEAAKLTIDSTEALQRIQAHWIARIAHDFRGPLFAARGYAKLALENSREEETVTKRRYLESTVENLTRIAALVEGLREFPTERSLQLEPVDLSQLFREQIRLARSQYRGLRFDLNLPAAAVVTIADRPKVTNAVHKLLGLAVEFSQSQGEVQTNVKQESGEVTVHLSSLQQDSANGVSPEALPDITMPSEALRLHGGTLNVSRPRDGLLFFTLRLPLIGVECH